MKKLLSLLLVAVMLLSALTLVSCGDDDSKLPIDDDESAGSGDAADSGDGEETEEDSETETEIELEENGLPKEYFSDYIPDENAQYTGMVGIGANKAGVDFDNFRVIYARKDIIYEEFTEITELNPLIFSGFAAPGGDWDADLADWVIGADELDEENKQLTFTAEDATNAMLLMGNTEWGPYRLNVKVKLADETEVAYVYFCVQDEKNYYVLEVGADNNTCIRVSKVTDGTSEVVSELGIPVTVGEWVATSVALEQETVTVYVGGNEYIRFGTAESDAALVTNKFGVGQWQTQFYVDNYKIIDIETGEVYYSQDFENADDFVSKCTFGNRNGGNYTYTEGDWVIKEAVGVDGNTTKVLAFEGATTINGAMILFPDITIPETCNGYKIVMDAYRVGGAGAYEFIATVWGYQSDNDYINFNYGGWSGAGAYQVIAGGSKTNHDTCDLIGLETGVWVQTTVEVYKDVSYAYYGDKFVQLLWFD